MTQQILLDGRWQTSTGTQTFQAYNPKTKEPLAEIYPVSPWDEVERAIMAADVAGRQLRACDANARADFLERYADRIQARAGELIASAHAETALPIEPRLSVAELPRTMNQLRQAAKAARERTWSMPTIDTANNIRSFFGPIGPVCVFGPNNFPFAFNSVAGGDFAAAIAAGNPVIAKANSSHPATSRLFAEEAIEALRETKLPLQTVQLIYRLSHSDGEKLVSHPKIGATGYTGARSAGLQLKNAADRAGKPIYLELSSVNPVVFLPGALKERLDALVNDYVTSALMGAGQFCTNPGLVLLIAGPEADEFLTKIAQRFESAPVGTLLGPGVESALENSVNQLTKAGAQIRAGGQPGGGTGFCYRNTLLTATAKQFLHNPHGLGVEAFGNASLFVLANDKAELKAVLSQMEGNLTGTIYTHTQNDDDALYQELEPELRSKVGRLLNDKMPTGVAVSPAMNHGGPYPATGHPGFTAVGIPASLHRFAALNCYDNVRNHRLPIELRNEAPPGNPWRFVDGVWKQGSI